MLTLDKNPFAWNERGNISGVVGALSLATQNGSLITVGNLSEDVEVSSLTASVVEDSEDCLICSLGSALDLLL